MHTAKNSKNKGASAMSNPSKKQVSLHQTNWNKDPTQHAPKDKAPFMFGEGLGMSLGIDNTKAVPGKPLGYYDEQKRLQKLEAKQYNLKNSGKRRHQNYINWRYHSHILPKKIQNGDVLINQRIFLCDFIKPKWDSIARNIGIPDGVDIAHTDFGDLLLIPVIEFAEALQMGIDPKVAPPLKDVEGRPCWVSPTIKERIEMIFGRVRWTRPLTIKEAEQFGVKLKEEQC
jgi:hypothetical protein